MENSMVVESITSQNIAAAMDCIRRECQYTPAELDTLSIAVRNLETCVWEYDGELLVIESATTPFKRYHVAYDGCDCAAGLSERPCWHMSAFRLVQRAAEFALTPIEPQYQAIQAGGEARYNARHLERYMIQDDDRPTGEMKYSFKIYVQAYSFAGDLIITSTTVSDLVKALMWLERVDIQPMTATGHTNSSAPICPIHHRPMKPSRKPGSFYCSVPVGDGYCQEEIRL